MPMPVALLLSFVLHAALVVAPLWFAARSGPAKAPRIEARLLPPSAAMSAAESVSTDPAPPSTTPASRPTDLRGAALRRAQAALSEHLYYPPQAVADEVEGEVILLLVLAEDGRLLSASVARSSGHALLDDAALDAARRLGALHGSPRQTLFPVRFRLQ